MSSTIPAGSPSTLTVFQWRLLRVVTRNDLGVCLP